jgi:hypothetical protein
VRHKLLQFSILSTALLPAGLLADDASQCAGLAAVGGGCDAKALPNNINTIISTLFTVAGAVAVIILVVGGIRYITSTGDSQRIKAAKDTILYAIIGLVVVIVARAIVGYVAGSLS